MLVNSDFFGAALASTFTNSTNPDVSIPENTVVLMRRHGFTTWGPDIETAVDRAVYTKDNAVAQSNAIKLRAAFDSSHLDLQPNFELASLTASQAVGCKKMNEATQDKAWPLWVRKVEVNPLYRNNG
jgi:ribulose-5-phosphate 4-epimerase/fuculose-1-phosphate aldolase